jgi:hypothetical protein
VDDTLKPDDIATVPWVNVRLNLDAVVVKRPVLVHLVERRVTRRGDPYWKVQLHWPNRGFAFFGEGLLSHYVH